jgi:hypothetical protein
MFGSHTTPFVIHAAHTGALVWLHTHLAVFTVRIRHTMAIPSRVSLVQSAVGDVACCGCVIPTSLSALPLNSKGNESTFCQPEEKQFGDHIG